MSAAADGSHRQEHRDRRRNEGTAAPRRSAARLRASSRIASNRRELPRAPCRARWPALVPRGMRERCRGDAWRSRARPRRRCARDRRRRAPAPRAAGSPPTTRPDAATARTRRRRSAGPGSPARDVRELVQQHRLAGDRRSTRRPMREARSSARSPNVNGITSRLLRIRRTVRNTRSCLLPRRTADATPRRSRHVTRVSRLRTNGRGRVAREGG